MVRAKRTERRIGLANIARGVGFKTKAKTVIGLTVASDWPENPDCDVCVMDMSGSTVDDKLIEMTDTLFGRPYFSRA